MDNYSDSNASNRGKYDIPDNHIDNHLQTNYYHGNDIYNNTPPQQQYHNSNIGPLRFNPLNEPVSFKDWLLTLFLMKLPIVNLILPFVWGFGGNTKESKKNFSRAFLVLTLIRISIFIIFIIVCIIFALTTINSRNELNYI